MWSRQSKRTGDWTSARNGDMDRIRAIAYLRRDSSGKVTSERRIISLFAREAGFQIVAELSDESGTDIFRSPGFARVLKRIELTGVQTVIVASAASFSPDALVQAVGRAKLSRFGITLIAADRGGFTSELITDRLVEHLLDQASAFDNLLREARARGTNERLRRKVGPNWRKQYVDIAPDAVGLAKNIYEMARRSGSRVTLREISAQLAAAGHLKKNGKPFHPQEIDRMIKGPNPRLGGRGGA